MRKAVPLKGVGDIAVFNGKQEELLENLSDMVKRRSSGDDKGGRIFDLLKPMKKLGGNTIKDGDDGEEPQFGHCWMRPSFFFNFS